MPELPDVELYVAALGPRVAGRVVRRVRVSSPFFVRTYDPPVTALEARTVESVTRMGKRIVWMFDDDLFAVVHLMIAGRLRWRERGAAIPAKVGLAAFDFDEGTLLFTEAGSRKQASMYLVRGRDAVIAMDPGGADVFSMTREAFAAALRESNHTLKRMLTDPHVFSGIGNAYSDEILHAAQLSPVKLTQTLADEEIARLFEAVRDVLGRWTVRLRGAAHRCSESCTRGTKRTTARRARPADACSPTGHCRGSCATTGRRRSRISSASSAADCQVPGLRSAHVSSASNCVYPI